VDGELPGGTREVEVPAELFDTQGVRLWGGAIKVPLTGPRPWITRFALPNIKEPKKQHRLSLTLQHEALDGDYREEFWFNQETAAVQSHGLRASGVFPQRKVFLTVGLTAVKGQEAREIPVVIRVRDGEDNAVLSKQAAIPPKPEPQLHLIDITPDRSAVGPFTLEASIESEAFQVFLNASLRFAQPNALVPVSSMEHGDPALWFATLPAHRPLYQTGQYYYSPHLTELKKHDSPAISYDLEVKHTGRQSLRIDYPLDRESDVWGLQALPGKPLALVLWVKGNESTDQLVVHFEDNSNFSLPAWERRGNFSTATVCKLDFAGWKRLRVPVLGDGLQVSSTKGSTDKVDAPIRILAFTIKPVRGPKPSPMETTRRLWIDDLAVETQALPAEMLSLEVQNDEAQGRLTSDCTLAITAGNGYPSTLKRGLATLTARDARQSLVWTKSLDLEVPSESFATTTVPLRELAEKKPRGPVDVDITFQDAARPGTRLSRRITLKAHPQACIFHDFEEPISFSGYQPGKVGKSSAKIVAGGADGTGHALALPVKPKQEDNSVLFHPAVPGIVERIEMMIQGGERPVTLQPWLIDSGFTGIWLRPYNLFSAEPIVVDWKGWRKVIVPAPPVPAHYGDKNRYFLFRPWYPLHLALNAKVDGETPVEIRIDDIRVVTHLPEDEQIRAELDYPDDTRIHPPGSPLRLIVWNYAPEPAALSLRYELRSYQGFTAKSGKVEVSIPAGVKQKVTLLPSFPPGIYDLSVQGVGKNSVNACVMALDARKYFGEDPLATLIDPLALRKQLGLMTEKTYLDWDNFEAAPYLFHHNWFEGELKKVRALPILPRELIAISAKNDAALAAAKEAEQALRTAQQQAVNAINTEKQAAMKVEATEKLLPPAQMEEETISKQATAATMKADAATKDADAAKMLAAEAMKTVLATETAQKTAMMAVQTTEKDHQTAMTALKDIEAKATQTQMALAVAEKEATAGEAAAKAAEADPKQKDKVKALRDRATELKRKAETAKAALDTARAFVAIRKADVDKARLLVEMARKSLTVETAKVQAAKQAHQPVMQKATSANQATEQAKRDAAAVAQRLQAAKGKVANLVKMLDSDRMTLADRIKATATAKTVIEKAETTLEEARTAAEKASKEFEEAKIPYALRPVPVVGFCAEWAGPESLDAMLRGTYTRWIPNRLQLPRRLVDWSEFIRATQREHRGRFDSWVFWENPDLVDSPQSIPPRMYRPMLDVFSKWVKLYSPEAKVVAGGFNFPRAVDYLAKIKDAHTLPFDEIAVQMNLAELSPEQANLEGFLDELNDLLKVDQTRKLVRPTELDWSIGKHLSPLQQAAYHARATLILDSCGVPAHQLSIINTGFDFEGFGVFYRVSYGSSPEVQTFKPYHVPKPSYFALMESRRFLSEWKFVTSVNPPDRSLWDNRAFIYRNKDGRLTAVLWRAVDRERVYRIPASWQGVKARDIFGFEASLENGLRCTPMPTLVELPAGYQLDQLVHDLRVLTPANGSHLVLLDLHLNETHSAQRAGYEATGTLKKVLRSGAILGEGKVRETYLEGLQTEKFSFELPQAGNVLLLRRWFFDGAGEKLFVKHNGGAEQLWDLSKGQGNEPGLRQTTFVLRNCKAGKNEVAIRHEKPGNCAGYRLEPMPADHLPLERLGMFNGRQTKGEIVKHISTVGTPLTLGQTIYESGIGTHATSFIEYPLAGQFSALQVTVGIDAVTEGRGSVLCRIFVDGKERASSGIINGFSKPKTFKIDKLEGAQRLILSVTDAGDGNRDDLADWVEGKLLLKR
jgi:hypothetical protein